MEQNDKTTKSLEEALNQALKLWEDGLSRQEILDLLPEHKKELNELFQVVEIIKENKSEVMPSKELLDRVLSQIDASAIAKRAENRSISINKNNINNKKKLLLKGLIGQFSIFELFNTEKLLNFMPKKVYFLSGVTTMIIVLIAGVYYFKGKELVISPESQELAYLAEDLTKDIDDLDKIAKEGDLGTINQDLLDLSEEDTLNEISEPKKFDTVSDTTVDISSINNFENELNMELERFLDDLSDLEGFDSDTSLNNFDTALSGFNE